MDRRPERAILYGTLGTEPVGGSKRLEGQVPATARSLPTERSERVNQLADWARKNMKAKDLAYCIKQYSTPLRRKVFDLLGEPVIHQAIKRWGVTRLTAESYAEAVFVKLKG